MNSQDNTTSNVYFARGNRQLLAPTHFEMLLRATISAKRVSRHRDYYRWLQDEICQYLPHEILLAAWGDFQSGDLSYDVASTVPGVDTRAFINAPGLALQISGLYTSALGSDRYWCALQDLRTADACPVPASRLLDAHEAGINSLLAYAMRDERDGHDCLYTFYTRHRRFDVDPDTLDFIMPHIDATLRRVRCLTPAAQPYPPARALSEREQEVMQWVCEGKSNLEIGEILCISHNTVKNHLKHVFRKLNVTARSQAVRAYLGN